MDDLRPGTGRVGQPDKGMVCSISVGEICLLKILIKNTHTNFVLLQMSTAEIRELVRFDGGVDILSAVVDTTLKIRLDLA